MKDIEKIKVLCVDDHAVVREGIATIINLQPDMMLVGAAATGKEALERFFALRPDVTLVDLQLPDSQGFETVDMATPPRPIVTHLECGGLAPLSFFSCVIHAEEKKAASKRPTPNVPVASHAISRARLCPEIGAAWHPIESWAAIQSWDPISM